MSKFFEDSYNEDRCSMDHAWHKLKPKKKTKQSKTKIDTEDLKFCDDRWQITQANTRQDTVYHNCEIRYVTNAVENVFDEL